MDQHVMAHRKTVLEEVSKRLTKNNFTPIVTESREDAAKKIIDLIPHNVSVGVGGSMTVKELALVKLLKEKGNTIIQHTPGWDPKENQEIRKKALTADVYMSSPNALTREGTLIFCDGVGNRVAAMIFGPSKIIAIAGINKVVLNEDEGWDRIGSYASPINVKRLGLDTPCAKIGVCCDCNSPQRICNVGVTLWKKPKNSEYYVVLVPEVLGY